jgi:hypothetical protein
MEFLQSWTFLIIMAGLLCLLVLFIPLCIVLVILFAARANRNRENPGREDGEEEDPRIR